MSLRHGVNSVRKMLNIPRKWVVSDEQIVEACRREPASLDELYMVRGLRESLKANDARQVLQLIKTGLNCPEEDLPQTKCFSAK